MHYTAGDLQIFCCFFKKGAGQSGPRSHTVRVKLCQLELGTAERLLSNPTMPGLHSAPCIFHLIIHLIVAKLKRFEFKFISLASCAFYFQLYEKKADSEACLDNNTEFSKKKSIWDLGLFFI